MTKTEPTVPVPAVYRAIANVQQDLAIEGIAKNRKNQAQGFSFRGVDDIYQALSPLLSKHDLFLAPQIKQRECETRTTKSGNTMYAVCVHIVYRVTSAKDGSYIEVSAAGEAMDNGDKATSKAMSMAYKYMAFQLFCIPVEGSDDADYHTPPQSQPQSQKAPATKPAPAPAAANQPEYDIGKLTQQIQSARSMADLNQITPMLRNLPDLVKTQLRKAYTDAQQVCQAYDACVHYIADKKTRQPFIDYAGNAGVLLNKPQDVVELEPQHIVDLARGFARQESVKAAPEQLTKTK